MSQEHIVGNDGSELCNVPKGKTNWPRIVRFALTIPACGVLLVVQAMFTGGLLGQAPGVSDSMKAIVYPLSAGVLWYLLFLASWRRGTSGGTAGIIVTIMMGIASSFFQPVLDFVRSRDIIQVEFLGGLVGRAFAVVGGGAFFGFLLGKGLAWMWQCLLPVKVVGNAGRTVLTAAGLFLALAATGISAVLGLILLTGGERFLAKGRYLLWAILCCGYCLLLGRWVASLVRRRRDRVVRPGHGGTA